MAGASASPTGGLWRTLRIVGWILVVAVALFAVGWILELVRFATAQLPAVDAVGDMSIWQILSHGALWSAETIVVGAVLGVVAWLAARRSWKLHADSWRAVAGPGADHGPDWPLQVVVGVNILIGAGLIAIGVGQAVQTAFVTHAYQAGAGWLAALIGILVFAGAWFVLSKVDPGVKPRVHLAVWVLVGLAALFASAPVGVLLLTGAIVATVGRRIAAWTPPETLGALARSKVVWLVLGICGLLGVAYSAMGPVGLDRVVVKTPGGDVLGGYVGRGSEGVSVATCTALADATSTDTRLALVPTRLIGAVATGGGTAYFDTGARPSLGRLALHALGIGANPPTLFSVTLRATQPTCAGTGPVATAPGVAEPGLGPGVVAGPAPIGGRALFGEAPIRAGTPGPDLSATIADLALRYQPTLLVTAADRNWPVSLGAYLAERGRGGRPVCLDPPLDPRHLRCPVATDELTASGRATDYINLPDGLGAHPGPDDQFRAFLTGVGQTLPPRREWLSDPSSLNPWRTAQIYFYYRAAVEKSKWPPAVHPQGTLAALEYWFLYPYNYYPTVIDSDLMDQAPLAGDDANTDLHQSDWEHVDVLLDPTTMQPKWLYLARHATEGQFIPWDSPLMRFDDGHPLVQAAFGGHPSYLPGCGPGPRALLANATGDWLSCGSGRFAFRGSTTPLVNLAAQGWVCWPGFFGQYAKDPQRSDPTGQIYAKPPVAPMRQAENAGVCPKAS